MGGRGKNLLSIGGSLKDTVGVKNPFRYRGYYYDTETGLYYLQSRYYNPGIGRFISKDDVNYHQDMTGAAANLYSYCGSNPVMNHDDSGDLTKAQINKLIRESFLFKIAYACGLDLSKSFGSVQRNDRVMGTEVKVEISFGHSSNKLILFTYSPGSLGLNCKNIGIGLSNGFLCASASYSYNRYTYIATGGSL